MAQSPRGQESRSLPIEWHFPPDVVSRYATSMTVQFTDHEFIISFFEAHPPLIIGSPEERKAKVEQIKSVRADCVARIVVAAGRMPEFVKVLHEHMTRWQAAEQKKGTMESGNGE